MVYTEREKLTVIELTEERDILTFEEIEAALWERPSNMVYVEYNGELYGIVGSGAIPRAIARNKKYVEIVKNFTYVYPGEYMRARQIFKERKKTIHALPIVNESGELRGGVQ